MPLRVTTETPREDEARSLRYLARICPASIIYIIVFFTGGTIGVGWLLHWIGSCFSPQLATAGALLGLLLGVGSMLYLLVTFLAFNRAGAARARQDLARGLIEVDEVESSVAAIGRTPPGIPVALLQIDAAHLLVLHGNFLYDYDLFVSRDDDGVAWDAPEEEQDADDTSRTREGRHRGFPNSHVVLRRFPVCGDVRSIALLGERLVARTPHLVITNTNLLDSMILGGSIQELVEQQRVQGKVTLAVQP